jgi:hypothetical protein
LWQFIVKMHVPVATSFTYHTRSPKSSQQPAPLHRGSSKRGFADDACVNANVLNADPTHVEGPKSDPPFAALWLLCAVTIHRTTAPVGAGVAVGDVVGLADGAGLGDREGDPLGDALGARVGGTRHGSASTPLR